MNVSRFMVLLMNSLVVPGDVFVATWASVAAAKKNTRVIRKGGDLAVALDDYILALREDGYRIGVVVDEAHHGFTRASEAVAFYRDVLRPDFTLLITTTPDDTDVDKFKKAAGIGELHRIRVSRKDAVDAGLIKDGIKSIAYIAPDDQRELLDFSLTALMLVQVGNSDRAVEEARERLQRAGVPESAIAWYTASDPNDDLLVVAKDESKEVLIFKVAVALGFDLAFMVWVILGPLGVDIAKDLGLDAAQKGLMVATPVLSGALLRIVMGVLVDRLSPKKAAIIGQIIVIAALTYAWLAGIHSYQETLILGLFLGVAGASFAAALPLASRWYPPEHQGTAMGIAGAGNSGTALAALFAPGLAAAFGWTNVFGVALTPLVAVFIFFIIVAKDAPGAPPPKTLAEYLKVLKDKDAWWFMFFYSVTFGGFVGLASSLVIYFNTQYGLDPKVAGLYTAACVFAGSLVRPIGGNVADRVGGVKSLTLMYLIAATFLAIVSVGLPTAWLALAAFVCAMLALGMGNGAVFQLVPQRFKKEIGVMTGLVGMAGGVGGFYVAASLGYSKQLTGSYQAGFRIFAALAVLALTGLTGVKKRWRTTWGAPHFTTAKI